MKYPTVSVVIPAFNAEKYIGIVLSGMQNQEFSDWEVIVVDDHSTDRTVSIVQEYSGRDKRIKLYVRNRLPKGAQTCRNIGVERVVGKYMIVIDADDVISNAFLRQRVEYMDLHPEIDYASFPGKSFVIKDNEMVFLNRVWGCQSKYDDLLIGFLMANYPFGVWNNIYKTNVVKQLMFDENVMVYQDFDFLVRTILYGYKHAFADNAESDYFYRQGHSGTITSNFISGEKYESTKRLFDKIQKMIEESSESEKYKKAFFDFFLLQYNRVLLKGNDLQREDFYWFIKKYYGDRYGKRLAFLKMLVSKTKNGYNSKWVFLNTYLLFEPYKLLDWLKTKIL